MGSLYRVLPSLVAVPRSQPHWRSSSASRTTSLPPVRQTSWRRIQTTARGPVVFPATARRPNGKLGMVTASSLGSTACHAAWPPALQNRAAAQPRQKLVRRLTFRSAMTMVASRSFGAPARQGGRANGATPTSTSAPTRGILRTVWVRAKSYWSAQSQRRAGSQQPALPPALRWNQAVVTRHTGSTKMIQACRLDATGIQTGCSRRVTT